MEHRTSVPSALRLSATNLAAVLVCAGIWTYRNSLDAPGVFDDNSNVFRAIDRTEHSGVSDWIPRPREFVFWSIALNHEVGGLKVRGYRQLNRLIHIVNALLLFGIVRRTLQLHRFSGRFDVVTANWLAFCVALLWLVHPLQTQAVTYMVQRIESMMATCYLGCLYCLIRGAESRRRWLWYGGTIAAFWVGVGTKEVIGTAPLVLALYDRAVLVDSWRQVWQRRWLLYATMMLPLALFAFWITPYFSTRDHIVGLGHPWISPWMYARTQPAVIAHYLWLTIWPDRLCLDYCWPVMSLRDAAPWILLLAAMLAAGVWCWIRWKPFGFLILSYFVILAPTSSFIPINDLAVEHRMYLPLACLATLLTIGGFEAARASRLRANARLPVLVGVVALAATGLAARTVARNRDYDSPIRMWRTAVEASPASHRARYNLGVALWDEGRREEAAVQFHRGFEEICRNWSEGPEFSSYYEGLAGGLRRLDRSDELPVIIGALSEELPSNTKVQALLGELHFQRHEFDASTRAFRRALSCDPTDSDILLSLANSELEGGNPTECIALLRSVIDSHTDQISAMNFLAWVLATHPDEDIRDGAEAVRLAEQVCLAMEADDGISWGTLAGAYAEAGDFERAVWAADCSIECCAKPNDPGNEDAARKQREYYKSGRPFRMQIGRTETDMEAPTELQSGDVELSDT